VAAPMWGERCRPCQHWTRPYAGEGVEVCLSGRGPWRSRRGWSLQAEAGAGPGAGGGRGGGAPFPGTESRSLSVSWYPLQAWGVWRRAESRGSPAVPPVLGPGRPQGPEAQQAVVG